MLWKIVLAIVSVLIVIDSLFPLFCPRWSIKILNKIARKGANNLRKIGAIEFIIGIILFLIAVYIVK